MTVSAPLTVVAPGGWTNPSARVRALAWAQRWPGPTAEHTYLDTAEVRPRTLLRRAPAVAEAEVALRRLAAAPQDGSLLVQREASPLSTGALEERLLRRAGRGVLDVDDALHVPRGGLSPRRLLASHRKIARLAAAADVVVVGNDLLAGWAATTARCVVRIPSCIDLGDYAVKDSYDLRRSTTLLWIGSVSTEPYLHALAPALTGLARRLPLPLRVLVVGAAGQQVPAQLAPLVERRPWSPEAVRTAVLEADVGLMPLPDTPFTRGKCAYKLLQYAAAGLPVVGSPVGASAAFLDEAGAPAPRDVASWTAVLEEVLTADAAHRAALGAAARAVVARRYTYEVWWEEWRAAVAG